MPHVDPRLMNAVNRVLSVDVDYVKTVAMHAQLHPDAEPTHIPGIEALCDSIANNPTAPHNYYVLDASVISLAESLAKHKEGDELPFYEYADGAVSVFFRKLSSGEQLATIVFSSLLPPNDVCTFTTELATSPNFDTVAFSCMVVLRSQHPKCSILVGTVNDNMNTASRAQTYTIVKQLIDARHITVVDRVAKERAKVNGRVVKSKQSYKLATIDVDKDVLAYNTSNKFNDAGTGGTKRFHHVNSFLRLRLGKVEVVKAHFRGRGLQQPQPRVSRVIASKHKHERG